MNEIDRSYKEFLKSPEWKKLAEQRRQIDGYRCQMCGTSGTPLNWLEVHHFGYQGERGSEDPYRDLVCVCHCCHKLLHRLMNRVTSADGKRGWRDNPYIPHISVFTTDYIGMEVKEGETHEQHEQH